MPTLGVEETNVSPAGSESESCKPVAPNGPLLVTVMVKVTLVPKMGAVLLTDFVTERSVALGVTTAVAWSSSAATLFPGVESLSNWSLAVTWAVLVLAPCVAAVAVICSVADAPLARAPMVQTPVPLL